MPADPGKLEAIRLHFAPVIGRRIVRYQTAELLHEDGTWAPWPDLPIRLYVEESKLVTISWSCFDDLSLTNEESLPYWADEASTRWIENGIERINTCLGQTIRSVLLGRGDMRVGDCEMEIWIRLVLELDDCWLEVLNALDENGYALHHEMPAGEFEKCL